MAGTADQTYKAELLDLYEARVKHKFALMSPSGDPLMDYKSGITHAARLMGERNALPEMTRDGYIQYFVYLSERILKMAHFTFPGEKLPILNDVGSSPPLQVGCGFEPLAVFDQHKNGLTVDSEIWSALDSLNKAALLEHEIYYLMERVDGEHPTSESTRLHVAHMFASEDSVKATDADLPKTGVQYCSSFSGPEPQTGFYLYLSDEGLHQTLQFSFLIDNQLLARSTIVLQSPITEFFSAEIPLKSTYDQSWSIQVRAAAPRNFEIRLLENGKIKGTSKTSCIPTT